MWSSEQSKATARCKGWKPLESSGGISADVRCCNHVFVHKTTTNLPTLYIINFDNAYHSYISPHVTTSVFLPLLDPSSELRLHGSRTEWQHPLWLLLPGGAPGHLPGPGHGGHRQGHELELRLHCGVRRKLRGKRRGRVHSKVPRGR